MKISKLLNYSSPDLTRKQSIINQRLFHAQDVPCLCGQHVELLAELGLLGGGEVGILGPNSIEINQRWQNRFLEPVLRF